MLSEVSACLGIWTLTQHLLHLTSDLYPLRRLPGAQSASGELFAQGVKFEGLATQWDSEDFEVSVSFVNCRTRILYGLQ